MVYCLTGCLPISALAPVATSASAAAASKPAAAPHPAEEAMLSEVSCAFGKASAVFPLTIPASAALGLVGAAAEKQSEACEAEVTGYTTPLTTEAGACSVRFALPRGVDLPLGNYAVAVKPVGRSGWLPGLGNTKLHKDGSLGVEVVVLARADVDFKAVMYLPEEALASLWPCGQRGACVRVVQPLLMKQLADCPGQWLRDRLLKLSSRVEDLYDNERIGLQDASSSLRNMLSAAGLRFNSLPQKSTPVGPADMGDRISRAELGFWQEEAHIGNRCAGSMDGEKRLDVPDDIIASML